MALQLPDLDQFFDATLPLPVGGKTYVIQPPTSETGLYVQKLIETGAIIASGGELPADAPKPDLDDGEELDLYKMLLGGALAEMKRDRVPWPKIQFCANTALIWIGMGDQAAEAYWISGGDPKASPLSANRAQRRATAFRPTGEESTTPGPESTNGTRRRNRSSSRRRGRPSRG